MAPEDTAERSVRQFRKWNVDPNECLGDLTLRDLESVASGAAGNRLASVAFLENAHNRSDPFALVQPDNVLAIGIPIAPGARVDPSLVAAAPAFLVRGFTSVVGACISVASAHNVDRWVHLEPGTNEFTMLASGRFVIHLLDRRGVVASQQIDFAKHPRTLAGLQSIHAAIGNWTVPIPEPQTFRLVRAGDKFFADRSRSPSQLLMEGWARHRTNALEAVCDDSEDIRELGFATKDPPSELQEFVETARAGDAATLLRWLDELSRRDAKALFRLFAAVGEYEDYTFAELPGGHGAHELLIHACDAFFSSPERSRCGRQLPWFDPVNACLGALPLVPEKMPDPDKVGDLWSDLWHYMPFRYAGRILQGTDQPIDESPENEQLDLERFPSAADPTEAMATARSLFQIAVSNKQWTIPPGAILDFAVGPFTHMQAWEFSDSCVFVCRTANGRYCVVEVLPCKAEIQLSFPLYIGEDRSDERVLAALHLIFAALIHDFFVLENRERVFETRTQRRPPVGCVAHSAGPVIVYLPRRRYLQKPNLSRCTQDLSLVMRRAHAVSGHLRKSGTTTDGQRALALRHGFAVAPGYTFVRPHERGATAREVIYRSRSATWLLFDDQQPTQEYQGSDWFRFERDVRSLMLALGFAVEHTSSGRRGDDGVDLYATKGVGLDQVSWVVQCKCFAANRKVDVATVRELVGALAQYPRGTRGLLVTTSAFTSDAERLAEREHVELIDGARFSKLRASASSTP